MCIIMRFINPSPSNYLNNEATRYRYIKNITKKGRTNCFICYASISHVIPQHKMCCTSNLYRQEFNVRVELHFALHLAQTIPCICNSSIMQNPRTQSFNLVF
jgi:hypothetical protein